MIVLEGSSRKSKKSFASRFAFSNFYKSEVLNLGLFFGIFHVWVPEGSQLNMKVPEKSKCYMNVLKRFKGFKKQVQAG